MDDWSKEEEEESREEKHEVERTPTHGTLVRDAAADWHQLLLSKCLVTRHESWKHANICSPCGKKYASKHDLAKHALRHTGAGRRLMPHCCCFPAVGQTLTQQSDTVTHQGSLSWWVSGLIGADHSRHHCLQVVHYNQSVFVLICDKAKLSSISCWSRMMPFAALEYLCEALS